MNYVLIGTMILLFCMCYMYKKTGSAFSEDPANVFEKFIFGQSFINFIKFQMALRFSIIIILFGFFTLTTMRNMK